MILIIVQIQSSNVITYNFLIFRANNRKICNEACYRQFIIKYLDFQRIGATIVF